MSSILLNRLEALEDKIIGMNLMDDNLMQVVNKAYKSRKYSYAINTINKLLDDN